LPVHQSAVTTASAEQLIQRHAGHLGLDVPERDVDCGDGAHRHGATAPVGTSIEELPDVFDPARIHADDRGCDVVREVRDDRQLAPVERGVADAVDTLIGLDLQGHEIPAGTGDDDSGSRDFHWCSR
jgi:hypothetical protein